MFPFKSYETLHITALRVQCILKSLVCSIFGASFKTAQMQVLIERNRKCIKNAPALHFGAFFKSRVQVSQTSEKRTGKVSKTRQKHICIFFNGAM